MAGTMHEGISIMINSDGPEGIAKRMRKASPMLKGRSLGFSTLAAAAAEEKRVLISDPRLQGRNTMLQQLLNEKVEQTERPANRVERRRAAKRNRRARSR